jgi:hypothetical protein
MGVAWTPSKCVIGVLSTMKGSSNWYCISTISRMVGLNAPMAFSRSGGSDRTFARVWPSCR